MGRLPIWGLWLVLWLGGIGVGAGAALLVTADHDPKPLRVTIEYQGHQSSCVENRHGDDIRYDQCEEIPHG